MKQLWSLKQDKKKNFNTIEMEDLACFRLKIIMLEAWTIFHSKTVLKY